MSAVESLRDTVPSWWPQWSGDCAAVVACGPSVNLASIEMLRGCMPVIAIKESVDLCPWAEVVYGCDKPWWAHRRGLPEFNGLKLSYEGAAFPGVHKVEVQRYADQLLFDRAGEVGAGGNSGFQALNLAVQFGARRILLVGFDMDDRSGVHYYGRNYWMGANNPDDTNFRRWRGAFSNAAKQLQAMRIEVINASPISALDCFGRATIEQALQGWKCLAP